MVQAAVNEIKLISHSNVIYWWPAAVVGYAMAFLSWLSDKPLRVDAPPGSTVTYANSIGDNAIGLIFIATLLLLIVFTNAKLRGIYSILTIVSVAFVALLFTYLDWWTSIWALIPNIAARANTGFYVVFASALTVVWLLAFFVFDRLTYWRIRPGQLIEQRLIGGGSHSVDTNGLVFEKREQDIFRHGVLGLGAGDIRLTSRDPRIGQVNIPNVFGVNRKVQAIEQIIAVKPEQSPGDELAAA